MSFPTCRSRDRDAGVHQRVDAGILQVNGSGATFGFGDTLVLHSGHLPVRRGFDKVLVVHPRAHEPYLPRFLVGAPRQDQMSLADFGRDSG